MVTSFSKASTKIFVHYVGIDVINKDIVIHMQILTYLPRRMIREIKQYIILCTHTPTQSITNII